MKGKSWRVLWPNDHLPFSWVAGEIKLQGTQSCPFTGPHPWPMRQPVVMTRGKACTVTSPVCQVRQWDVGIGCTAQLTSGPFWDTTKHCESHCRVPSRLIAKHNLSCFPHSILSPDVVGWEISVLSWVTGLPGSPSRQHHFQKKKLQAKGIGIWFCHVETLAECSISLLALKRS